MANEKDFGFASDKHNTRGIELADRGWLDEAIREFKRALELDPRAAHVRDNLASVYAEKKMFLDAFEEFVLAVRAQPDNPHARFNLGTFLLTQGLDFAIAELNEAKALDPENAETRLQLGMALADAENVPEALKEVQAAVHLEPRDPQARRELGALLLEAGESRSAITELREAVRLDVENFEAWADLGDAYVRQGFCEEADNAYNRAQELRPNDASLMCNRGALAVKRQRVEEALKYLEGAAALDKEHVRRWIRETRAFDALRSEPRLEALL